MMKFALIALVAACAGRVPTLELRPVNTSGQLTKQVRAGDRLVDIGLAYRGRQATVVRVDGLCSTVRLAGAPTACDRPQHTVVFAIPTAIAGVPATGFDYMIDPGPAVDGESDVPGRFTVVAASHSGHTAYRTTWVFTWNAKTRAFDASAPTTTTEDTSKCLVCDVAS